MTTTEESITVRRLSLEYAGRLDPMIIAGHPEESFTTVGLSLLLPYLEPYLIRTMQKAKPHVTNPDLVRDLDLFNAQEGQHYKQHIVFNESLDLPAAERVRALEAELDADYRRWSAQRSLRWNLAYAEGFEAFTTALARYSFETNLIGRLSGSVRDLFAWHLVEELEHRTVAFDAHESVCGGYFYRLFVGLFAQWHLNRFMMRTATTMANADPAAFRAQYGGFFAKAKRLSPVVWRSITMLLPNVLATYLPWYTPHHIELPAVARELASHYTALARSTSSAVARG